jgi:hypothetical protein
MHEGMRKYALSTVSQHISAKMRGGVILYFLLLGGPAYYIVRRIAKHAHWVPIRLGNGHHTITGSFLFRDSCEQILCERVRPSMLKKYVLHVTL